MLVLAKKDAVLTDACKDHLIPLGGGTPLYEHVGMCGPEGYSFLAVLV